MPKEKIRAKCSVANCENSADIPSRGLCRKHYLRWYKRPDGDLSDPKFIKICTIEGCGKKNKANGLCAKHLIAKKKEEPLTQERLRELLAFDEADGIFYWRINGTKMKIGSVAGSLQKDGYSRIMLDHQAYSVPKLAHFYVHGEWPKPAAEQEDLTQERLKSLFEYDPETGFFWHRTVKADSTRTRIGGAVSKSGYRYITIDMKSHLAHRLAFLYMTGKWPAVHVDHRDRNRDNNRWENLREATRKQNCGNQAARVNNKLGVKGVCKVGDRFLASINENGKVTHLGSFKTIEEASEAYRIASERCFGEFARSK